MKFGNFLFPESANPDRDAEVLAETLREAQISEQLGMDAVWLAEHHFDGNCAYVDPVTFATAIAMSTSRLTIGFAVIQASLYHPVRLAEQLALLDNLSRGRLILGLGRGTLFNIYEYQGYGIGPDEAQARFDELREVLLAAWSGNAVDHVGRFWTCRLPRLRPKPYTQPHPNIIGAASSEASLIAYARQNRPFLMAAQNFETTKARIDLYRREMGSAGFSAAQVARNLADVWVWRNVYVNASASDARRTGAAWFERMQAHRMIMRERIRQEQGILLGPESISAVQGLICGDPSEVLAQLAMLDALGIGGVILQFRMGPMSHQEALNSLELFMHHVAPALRG